MKDIERRFHEVDASLRALTDQNPESAISAARALAPNEILNAHNTDMLKASWLIDAGAAARDGLAVTEGVALFERLLIAAPDNYNIICNLANGLSAQAALTGNTFPQGYLESADMRFRARRYYWFVANAKSTPAHIAARSLTNLGNLLLRSHRLVEAYDFYLRAFDFDSSNGVALTGAARILLGFIRNGIGDASVLSAVAAGHLKIARQNPGRIRELVGEQGYHKLTKLMESQLSPVGLPDLSAASDYQKFIAKHRLALAPTIEGLDLTMVRWDSLCIASITMPIDAKHGVPPIFAMFNVLKSEYLAARFLAYSALTDNIPESGKYSDTLDYATYGVRSAVLTLAQRSCVDLLDKVAVAVSEYFDLPGSSKGIYFSNRWFETSEEGKPLRWQPWIQKEIENGNTALIAIAEVAADFAKGGFLHTKRVLRRASTHRFTILHDLNGTPNRECKHIEHREIEYFVNELIETLQISRAVLFYFVQMIRIREQRMADDGSLRVPILVPDHDWVRGVEDKQR